MQKKVTLAAGTLVITFGLLAVTRPYTLRAQVGPAQMAYSAPRSVIAGDLIRLHAANLASQATSFRSNALLQFTLLDRQGQVLARSVETVAPGASATLEFVVRAADLFRAEVRPMNGGAAFVSSVEVVDTAGGVTFHDFHFTKTLDK